MKGQSTMTSACYSVRQGAVGIEKLGGRAVLLFVGAALICCCGLQTTFAESGKETDGKEAAAEREAAAAAVDKSATKAKVVSVVRPKAEIKADEVKSVEAVPEKIGEPTIWHIGPVTTITEVSSGLPFPARVDTGATTCSIHYEAIEIEDASKNPEDNVGKRVRVLIKNPDGDEEWITTKIVDHVTVRTTTKDDERYKVQLNLRWQDVEKKVLVTLKDREKMKYPLLVGRNFLRGDFLVDVNMEGDAK
jgi:hypothetical protein